MTETKVKTVKGLVKDLRSKRDKINQNLAQMSKAERQEYFNSLNKKITHNRVDG